MDLKTNFLSLIQERLKSLNNVVYCPILNKKLTTKFIIGLFDFQFSKDKKTIKITYSKKTINNRTAEDIIRSIDYGTIDFKPRRIFYPIFDKFSRNSLKYMR